MGTESSVIQSSLPLLASERPSPSLESASSSSSLIYVTSHSDPPLPELQDRKLPSPAADKSNPPVPTDDDSDLSLPEIGNRNPPLPVADNNHPPGLLHHSHDLRPPEPKHIDPPLHATDNSNQPLPEANKSSSHRLISYKSTPLELPKPQDVLKHELDSGSRYHGRMWDVDFTLFGLETNFQHKYHESSNIQSLDTLFQVAGLQPPSEDAWRLRNFTYQGTENAAYISKSAPGSGSTVVHLMNIPNTMAALGCMGPEMILSNYVRAGGIPATLRYIACTEKLIDDKTYRAVEKTFYHLGVACCFATGGMIRVANPQTRGRRKKFWEARMDANKPLPIVVEAPIFQNFMEDNTFAGMVQMMLCLYGRDLRAEMIDMCYAKTVWNPHHPGRPDIYMMIKLC
ncbi:hypothetical protein F5B20DRAFT_588150 [Whalleya microplaca]|nr:hypothetical protein F5B20DRAFT_588150 [Whalleya microplaca]